MSNNENNGFHYTYSAKEQAELKRIREKYLASSGRGDADKMAQLRRLDASVTKGAAVFALCVGIFGTLIMGFGMSLIMTDMKRFFALDATKAMLIGIAVGLIGMSVVLLAYPLYQQLTKRRRKKVAPEILRLTEELMGESERS